jgi:hypothetical protein
MTNLKKIELRLHSDSPARRVGEWATPRIAESRSCQLSDSLSFLLKHSKADSPTHRVGESSTPRLAESESRRLPDSPTHRVGELFFDYEYLREFEAKIGTAQKVV